MGQYILSFEIFILIVEFRGLHKHSRKIRLVCVLSEQILLNNGIKVSTVKCTFWHFDKYGFWTLKNWKVIIKLEWELEMRYF